MFRRRSRGHYDPQQFNAGIPTRSASTSAAANAFYQQKLGAGAAAEALRRHSLDQAGSAAMQNFSASQPAYQPALTPPSLGKNARRNSIQARATRPLSSTISAPPRTNSLSNASLTSANRDAKRDLPHQSVSRSIQPTAVSPATRRNSLQRANSLTRTSTVVNRDASGRTMSLTTTTIRQMGSFELVSTKDVPIRRANSLTRAQLAPPRARPDLDAPSVHSLDSELRGIEEEPEESLATVSERFDRLVDQDPRDPRDQRDSAKPDRDQRDQQDSAKPDRVYSARNPSNQRDSDPLRSSHLDSAVHRELSDISDESDYSRDETPTMDGANGAVPNGDRNDREKLDRNGERNDLEKRHGDHGLEKPDRNRDHTRDDSDPASLDRNGDRNDPASLDRNGDRSSPARSAFRQSNSHSKAKVSFGGADPAYVYESYDYAPDPAPSPHLAAAAAAVRTRAPPKPFAQPHTVQKRPSTASLTGRSSLATASRAQNRTRADSGGEELPVPARSTARPLHSPVLTSPETFSAPEVEKETPESQIRAQALALVQQQFVQADYKLNEPREPKLPAASLPETRPAHLYRGLVSDDDAASVKSASSFTKERPAARGSTPARMRSLRHSQTPPPRRLSQQTTPSAPLSAPPAKQLPSDGFRKFSLRGSAPNFSRDEPLSLDNFTSRFADSDSDDEGGKSFFRKSTATKPSAVNTPGKISLGHVFSPNTEVKDLFGKAEPAGAASQEKPKKKNIFKRMFGRKKDH